MKTLAGRLTFGFCLAGLLVSCAGAATRYVSLDGTNDTAGGYINWMGAATNIQNAIDASANGDTILVSNGLYTVASGAQVVNINKSLNVQGVYGRDVTIIDGSAARLCVLMGVDSSTGTPIYVSGFTIRNGAKNSRGGGLDILGLRDMYLTDCVICNNVNTNNGGGGFLKRYVESTLVVSNCVIVSNQAPSGGAVYGQQGTNRFFNCVIAQNSASAGGAGFYALSTMGLLELQSCRISSNVANQGGGLNIQIKESDSPGGRFVVNNCTISENSATNSSGGGVYIKSWVTAAYISNCVIQGNVSSGNGGGLDFSGSGRLTGCLIAGNTTTVAGGGGVYITVGSSVVCENLTVVSNTAVVNRAGGFYALANSTAAVINAIIHGNAAGEPGYSNIYVGSTAVAFTNCCTAPLAGLTGSGNIADDPRYVNPADGNYRLALNSPCINAGTNQAWMIGAVDLDGRPRIDRIMGRVDMGAYEHIFHGTFFTFH